MFRKPLGQGKNRSQDLQKSGGKLSPLELFFTFRVYIIVDKLKQIRSTNEVHKLDYFMAFNLINMTIIHCENINYHIT